MKKLIITAVALVVLAALIAVSIPGIISSNMPKYERALASVTEQQKIRGCYLVEQSAKIDNEVIIYGSSELNTDYVSTHPANFFNGMKAGFTVNLVGRGSCQSIIHALNIIAAGDSLSGRKVVLITSPQSYVEGGIESDMFMANFSQQQYLRIMLSDDVSDDFKYRFSERVAELIKSYDEEYSKAADVEASRLMSNLYVSGSKAAIYALMPYFKAESVKAELSDQVKSAEIINNYADDGRIIEAVTDIDYELEADLAYEEAKKASSNNDFGIENGYYTTYIGRKLEQNRGKESLLSYSNSVEYDDLELLLDVCDAYGIKPLFVSVPLNGKWSDFTGFAAERRQEYYSAVAKIVSRHNCYFCDLTDKEYAEYYLCDTMHLGWLGWLEVDHAIERYYKGEF